MCSSGAFSYTQVSTVCHHIHMKNVS